MSYRTISEPTGVGKTQAAEYLRRAGAAGLARLAIDWPANENELKRRGVTQLLLSQEYLAERPADYSYTRFCDLHKIPHPDVLAR